jgi:hypothetical protein
MLAYSGGSGKAEQIEEEVSGQAAAVRCPRRLPDLAHTRCQTEPEHALIVIECKADNVTISLKDYASANYAQYEHAFFCHP